MKKPVVGVLMGSRTDLDTLNEAISVFKEFGILFEARVLSAHRTPKELREYVETASMRGIRVFIAAAGGSAALAGVVAAHTTLPVIGIPIETRNLGGLDSLLSTVQMPGGIPVGCMAIGPAGAKNAALYALAILGVSDAGIRRKIESYRRRMRAKIKAEKLQINDA